MDRPATAAQQKYLRSLAQKTGTSFTPPKTVGEASRQIKALKGRPISQTGDAWDRQAVSEGLTNGVSATARPLRRGHRLRLERALERGSMNGPLAELYRAESVRLVRQLSARLDVDRTLVEDAVQVAFIKYAAGKCPEGVPPGGWLYTVARREALHTFRREERPDRLEDVPEPATETGDVDDAVEAREALGLLAGLTTNQRRALGLLVAGYSYNEICDLTGHTYTWVNRHIREGRAVLRKRREPPS